MVRPRSLLLPVIALSTTALPSHSAVFNVKDYGAVPDGHTVNTVAIAKTFAACAAGGSENTVIFPAPGVYSTSAWEAA